MERNENGSKSLPLNERTVSDKSEPVPPELPGTLRGKDLPETTPEAFKIEALKAIEDLGRADGALRKKMLAFEKAAYTKKVRRRQPHLRRFLKCTQRLYVQRRNFGKNSVDSQAHFS